MSDPLSRIAALAKRWEKENDAERELFKLPSVGARAIQVKAEAVGRVGTMDHVLKQLAAIIPEQASSPPRQAELVARIDTYLQGSSSEYLDHSIGCDLLTEARDALMDANVCVSPEESTDEHP